MTILDIILNGIFLHVTESQGRKFLTGVATDSHRLSSSSLELRNQVISPIILPRKTVFQFDYIINQKYNEKLTMQLSENKIKFCLAM